jgi:Flp pilus assembly protein TadG
MSRRLTLRRLREDDRGVQAVEFALISLPLLYLLYGAISFGFTLNAQETATQLAREGARVAAICGTGANCTSSAQARVAAAAPGGFTIVSTTVTPCASPTSDASVIVETRPPLNFIPFLTSGTRIRGEATTPCGG